MRGIMRDLPTYTSLYTARAETSGSDGLPTQRRFSRREWIAFLISLTLSALFWGWPQRLLAADPSFTYHPLAIPHHEESRSVVGDMDGDGDLDIVNNVGVICFNDGTAACDAIQTFGGAGDVTVGDLDGDGDLDIVRTDGTIYLNHGATTFIAQTAFGGAAVDLALGDMDGDGDFDIVTDSGVIYLNDGAATFPVTNTFTATNGHLALGDLDGDQDLDIVAENGVIHFNNGAAAFPVTTTFASSGGDVAVGDMDSDGDLDIVAGPDNIYVYPNSGGVFTETLWVGYFWEWVESIAIADMNSDGNLDIVTGNWGENGTFNGILFNLGRGEYLAMDYSISGYLTNSVAIGDLDNDGDLDIVEGNWSVGDAIYLNDGGGVVSTTQARPYALSDYRTNCQAVDDIDNDGDLDIILGHHDVIVIYHNDGQGNFAIARNIGTGLSAVNSIAVGDIDGDGDRDLIAGADQNLIYINDGKGNFATAQHLGTGHERANSVVIADMDGDGDLDIVVGNGPPGNLADNPGMQSMVYLNDGKGNFGLVHPFGRSDAKTNSVAVGDLDGDHDLDIVTGTMGQNVVYLNDGQAHFTVARNFGANAANTNSVAVGDLDGDGDLDIVTGKGPTGESLDPGLQNVVYLNDGQGNFTQTRNFGTGTDRTRSVTVADMDKDGDLDIVVGNYNEQNFVYLNSGATFGVTRAFGTGHGAHFGVSVGDMDGDSNLDIIEGSIYFNDGVANFNRSHGLLIQVLLTDSMAVGDMDHDGDLDVVRGGLIHQNDGLGYFITDYTNHFGPERFIAVGDLDSDSDLDIVGGSGAVYLNDGQSHFPLMHPFAVGVQPQRITLGDMDGDGDLDIVGNGSGLIYVNDGAANFTENYPFGTGNDLTNGVTLGDMDDDGDLDIVVGCGGDSDDDGQPDFLVGDGRGVIYLNDGAGHFTSTRTFGVAIHLALGDMDGDGDLDIVTGNPPEQDKVYLNDGAANFTRVRNFGNGLNKTKTIAVGDLDGDGDLDILAGRRNQDDIEPDQSYLNDGQGNFPSAINFSGLAYDLETVAVGDLDGNGYLDIVTGGDGANFLYLNGRRTTTRRAQEGPHIVVRPPGATPTANFFARGEILSDRFLAIPYRLTDPQGEPVGRVAAFFSLDGGGYWQPAVPTTTTVTTNLATSPTGVAYTFVWDTYASGFFGRSDHVALRLVAYPRPQQPLSVGAFRYRKVVAGPYLWPYASATTFPFRVQGTQVRVVDSDHHPVANARVYRLPQGATTDADPMPNASQPFTTTKNGYLTGRGALAIGDQLLALAPITHSLNYTLYATSGIPNDNGLTMTTVAQAGVQTLTVSTAHPLMLFDVDVSLEWDAGSDGVFYDQLKSAFERASAILYDVSDGQVALGEVRIHPKRAAWLSADMVIYANNNLRPRATMGGLVNAAQDETAGLRGRLANAYVPGQVRMGPIWDPFGQNAAELTQDWQRALAHELAHYLLYLPDNYLGVENGILRITNCQGSFMTDAYNPGYSELLTPTQWHTPNDPTRNPCLRTVAASLLTGRSDWETVTHFYPELHIPTPLLDGPALLPLDVTRVRMVTATSTVAQPVAARNYDLRDESGSVTVLRQAQAYVLQGQGTATPTDDALLYLGTTGVGSDRIMVRGAVAGDKVCVIDNAGELVRAGCETVTAQSTSIQVRAMAGWRPEIQLSPVTSATFQITVTQAGVVGQLFAQLLPAYGPPDDSTAIRSVAQPLTLLSGATNDTYNATISLPYPTFEGFVWIYSDQNPDQRQAITQFFLGGGWGPPTGWVGNGANRAWGANTRSLEAPVASGDGKVTILNLDDLLADTGDTTLQTINDLPNLPPWLTPVGAGYRIQSNRDITRTLMFQYNQRDVPPGYEQTLNIYYLAPAAGAWQRLQTGPLANGVDVNENLATVVMPHTNRGQGIYAVMATAQLQPLLPGWNALTYPIAAAKSVTNALASLDGAYTLVYEVRPNQPGPWPLYARTVDPVFAPLVNTLATMNFGSNYLIYATQVVTPYLPVVGAEQAVSAATNRPDGLLEPPATLYGFMPSQNAVLWQPGMSLVATIGSVTCGESTLQSWQGQLAYVVQVRADNGDGCGQRGQTVNFAINGQPAPFMASWDNRQVTQLLAGAKLYLPIIAR